MVKRTNVGVWNVCVCVCMLGGCLLNLSDILPACLNHRPSPHTSTHCAAASTLSFMISVRAGGQRVIVWITYGQQFHALLELTVGMNDPQVVIVSVHMGPVY